MAVQGLAGISRRYLRQRPGRTLLTGIGIALGVSLFLSNLIVRESSKRAVYRFESPGWDVSAWPTAGTAPGEAFAPLTDLEGVEAVLPILWEPVNVAASDAPNTTHSMTGQFLFGVELAGLDKMAAADPGVRDHHSLEPTVGRRFRDDADEVMLSERHAKFLGIESGDYLITRNLPVGPTSLKVTGLLGEGSLAMRNDGRVLITSLSTAQRLTEQPGTLSYAAINLEDDLSARQWRAAAPSPDPQLELSLPGESGDFDRAVYQEMTNVFAVYTTLIVFGAGFLIFLSLSLAVSERQATLGVLRALGASRPLLFRHVVGEGMALGAIATLAGLPIGIGIAAAWIGTRPGGPGRFPTSGVPVTGGALAMAGALGIGTTLFATVVPAWRASRLTPIDAIRDPTGTGHAPARWTYALGAMALGGGWATAMSASERLPQTVAGLLLMMTGSVLLVPAIIPALLRWRPSGTVRLALAHLRRERTRASYTVALVMLVMAVTIALGTAESSFLRTGNAQIDAMFGRVLRVEGGVDEDLAQQIRELRGVDEVTPMWRRLDVEVGVNGARSTKSIWAIDPATYFDVAGFPLAAGDAANVRQQLAVGGSVVVPQQLASGLDDEITLMTTTGPRQFRVAGIYRTPAPSSDVWSSVFIGRRDARRYYDFKDPQLLTIGLHEDADAEAVQTAVEDLQDETRFWVADLDDLTQLFDSAMQQGRSLIMSMLVPAALVSGLGLANTLAVIILERRREIGILRSMGFDRRQARRLAIIETLLLVGIAALLAIPLGLALSVPVVEVTGTAMGTVLQYAYPWSWVAVALAIGAGLALVGSLAPARRAARIEVGAALRYE